MNKKAVWFAGAALLLALTGCSSGNSNGGSSAPKPADGKGTAETAAPANTGAAGAGAAVGKSIELRVSWWGSAARNEKMNKIFDLYEKQNPNIKIVRESAADNGPKLLTDAAARNLPDIFGNQLQINGAEYANKGLYEPLDDYVKKGLINLDGWDPNYVKAGMIGGKQVAVPWGLSYRAILVNADGLKRVGMDPPPADLSYKDFIAYGEQLKSKLPKDVYVIDDVGGHMETLAVYLRQKGKDWFTPDGKSLGFSKEDLAEYWSFWTELRKKGIAPPAQFTAENASALWENSPIVKGKLMLQNANGNWAKIVQPFTKDKILLHRAFVMPEGKSVGGEEMLIFGFGISRDSKHKEEAAKLLNWFVNDSEAQKLYNAELGVIGSPKAKAAIASTLDPLDAEGFKLLDTILKTVPNTGIRPEIEKSPKVLDTIGKFYEQVMFDKMTVDQAAEAAYKAASDVLK
ncbi:ABC transporter substrate-binding protein [Paenibacillus thalictri]|uniref:Extracellular solute-binding protein n=1 Tax=Paenibacillus thalictri TaxID=2527873 RepID=A0A4Q9DYU1_9BACL|nr:extracellular solute-binding protein [Paenibacillus thalictri]TBL81068.1 extracellular solute-binding protein [Paenibacillus thalictri]